MRGFAGGAVGSTSGDEMGKGDSEGADMQIHKTISEERCRTWSCNQPAIGAPAALLAQSGKSR
jgi:hypothetical protein